MGQLSRFRNLEIDWDMEPVDAVGLYLEWGNNGYGGSYENRVRGKNDESIYWVVYNWDESPKVFLVRRNSDGAEDLACLDLPKHLERDFKREMGDLKGTFPITDSIRDWLKNQIN